MWARARGWALWKAVITLADDPRTTSARADENLHVVADLLAEAASDA
jgi:hypothetical protein